MITHDKIERNVGLLIVLTLLVVSVGGLVEIVPLQLPLADDSPIPRRNRALWPLFGGWRVRL